MSKPEFVESLNCRKLSCPLPILKTKKAIDKLEVGQVLEMVATDPGSLPDVTAWARQTQHKLVHHEKQNDEFYFYIEKTH
ncbi:MAG: sulfurtransferase TusA family protein [Candidatus Heimdallarchaeota archaeon]|nr:sulfurtransferase TusA family protein [Candidatus Heimdallarchaeota archaeon]MDH5645334.1 sulfurtransferase TusA family protein [Candidatus Heimdallarchaeota archaeon]